MGTKKVISVQIHTNTDTPQRSRRGAAFQIELSKSQKVQIIAKTGKKKRRIPLSWTKKKRDFKQMVENVKQKNVKSSSLFDKGDKEN